MSQLPYLYIIYLSNIAITLQDFNKMKLINLEVGISNGWVVKNPGEYQNNTSYYCKPNLAC